MKFKKLIALVLCVELLILGLVTLDPVSAGDVPEYVKIDGRYYKVTAAADPATDTPPVGTTAGMFKTEDGDGRVWTDKTVRINADTDVPSFDVTLSTVGQVYESLTTDSVESHADVLLILDKTSSMETNDVGTATGGKVTRASALIDAVNNAMQIIFDANPNNRVEVFLYGNGNPDNEKKAGGLIRALKFCFR